jgi:ABC-type sugar transport system ATPase subunit
MSIVQLSGLKKYFDAVHAVDGVDLAIDQGEFLVILGPSGCGKTTLMRMIAGLEKPTAGYIHIGGDDVTGLPPRKRGVSMVFQSYALYPHMNVFNNIAFPLRAQRREKKYDKRAIREKVENTARLLEIDMLLDRRPRQLSGGQRQRVAIARAMVTQPAVLLLDEPLSNLDAKLRSRTRVEIKRLLRRFNITTVYVTHDQTEAQAMGDRIAVMQAGKIQQLGTYREIYDNPANMFVAGFVGLPPMNLMPAKAEQGGVRVDGHFVDLRNDALGSREGAPVNLGIRPESIELSHHQVDGSVPVEVYWVESHFSEQRKEVTFDLAGSRVIAKRPLEEEWDRNTTVYAKVPVDEAYVFDSDEARLI